MPSELPERMAQLAVAMADSAMAWAGVDPDDRIRAANGAFRALTGLPSGLADPNLAWADLGPATDDDERRLLALAVGNGRPVAYRKSLARPDGSSLPVRVVAHPLAGGWCWRLLEPLPDNPDDPPCSVLDGLRDLFLNLPVGVVAMDKSFRVTRINPAALAILGLEARQALGRPCAQVLGCDESALCPLRRSQAEGRPAGPDDWIVRDATGRRVEARLQAQAFQRPDGRFAGGVEVFQDISETKALERNRSRIISMLAHDMKTPLVSIRGFANLLLREGGAMDDRTRRKYAQVIEQEAARLDGFVHRFLEMSRLQDGALKLESRPMDLALELGRLLSAVRPQFAAAGVGLQLDAPPEVPLEADAELLGRVLANLLDNALHHSPNGGRVLVSVAADGGEVLVRVSDQGPGIEPDELPLIFQPYYRGRNSKSRQGYGLGLAAAKAIAGLHGGRLVVDSQPGHGAVFTLGLPMVQP